MNRCGAGTDTIGDRQRAAPLLRHGLSAHAREQRQRVGIGNR
jgi:hypothetical protein